MSADDLSKLGTVPACLPQVRIRWVLFFAFLLGPAVATLISAFLMGGTNESVSPAIGFFGGGVGGLICGIMLGRRLPNTRLVRVMVCLLLGGVMAVVSVMLCFAGCIAGGYKIEFH